MLSFLSHISLPAPHLSCLPSCLLHRILSYLNLNLVFGVTFLQYFPFQSCLRSSVIFIFLLSFFSSSLFLFSSYPICPLPHTHYFLLSLFNSHLSFSSPQSHFFFSPPPFTFIFLLSFLVSLLIPHFLSFHPIPQLSPHFLSSIPHSLHPPFPPCPITYMNTRILVSQLHTNATSSKRLKSAHQSEAVWNAASTVDSLQSRFRLEDFLSRLHGD